ncbi:MAG: pyruvate kinase [Desulfurococcaceae archaeon]
MIKTKILVTMGPSSSSQDVVELFMKERVSGIRINFSHGDPNTWDTYVKTLIEASEKYGQYPALIGDLPGAQARIEVVEAFQVKKGEVVPLLVRKEGIGEKKAILIESAKLLEKLDVGDVVLVDDGRLKFIAKDVSSEGAQLISLSDGVIGSRKTIVIEGKEHEQPFLTEKSIEILKYAVSKGFTYLMLSYVRSQRDVRLVKDVLRSIGGSDIGLIAKIETRSAYENLAEIVNEADAILIARGDLGMHFGLEEIPSIQSYITLRVREVGKPVIVATQLMESMVNNPQPTRSEVVDVMNCVKEGVDAVLLTGETAIGKYPVEAVKWLKKIISTAEKSLSISGDRKTAQADIREKYTLGLVLLAESLGAKLLVYTMSGSMPSRISKYRPQVEVYAGTSSKAIVKKLSIYYGINVLLINDSKTYEEGLNNLYRKLLEVGVLSYGDIVILTYGSKDRLNNYLRIFEVISTSATSI